MNLDQAVIFDLLERLTSLTRVWFREHPMLEELQPIQLSALLYLARCNRYSNTPLAVTDYLGLTKGTVSQSLKALEAKGYLTKVPDARDKRIVHLELTPISRELIDAVIPPSFLLHAARKMGAGAVDLENLLMDLLRNIQRGEDVPGFGLCHTCSFHQKLDNSSFCKLTNESLTNREVDLICREHEYPVIAQEDDSNKST